MSQAQNLLIGQGFAIPLFEQAQIAATDKKTQGLRFGAPGTRIGLMLSSTQCFARLSKMNFCTLSWPSIGPFGTLVGEVLGLDPLRVGRQDVEDRPAVAFGEAGVDVLDYAGIAHCLPRIWVRWC